MWRTFEDDSGKKYRLSDINVTTYYSFLKYCDSRGYAESSKYLFAAILKAALNSALQNGVSNVIFQRTPQFKTKPDAVHSLHVYLTPEELARLENLPLEKNSIDERVRDIFLVGCYTGQRFSDYSNIGVKDLVSIEMGGKAYPALKILQKKTGRTVLIPVIAAGLMEILQKWGGALPSVSLSCLNFHLKNLCLAAGITAAVKIEERRCGKVLERVVPKWQLVTSHTARRTCITLLHLDGRLTSEQIRAISGHRSESAFSLYLCQSMEDEARSIIRALEKGV